MGDRPESAVGGRHGFPDAAAVFQWRPRSVAEIKDTCIVALDTNVLAVPYTVSSRSLDEIAAVYRRLRDQDRLRLPGQVAREFVGVRNKKLGELLQQLNNRSSEAKAFGPERYPLLVGLPEYERMLDLEQAMNTTVKEYRKAAKAVTGAVRQWTWNDPVSLVYAGIFDNNVVVDAGVPDEEISADAEGRKRHGIPPGHKDAGKEQNAYGDLVIWRTLLRLGAEATRDVLFVTEETKADWWHRSMDVTLYPRHELIEDSGARRAGALSSWLLSVLSWTSSEPIKMWSPKWSRWKQHESLRKSAATRYEPVMAEYSWYGVQEDTAR